MAKKSNPTIAVTPLSLGGKEYSLVFDFAALAEAEAELRKQGVHANLLHALDIAELDASGLAAMLYAGLHREQPKLTFADTLAMITFANLSFIFDAVLKAYVAAHKPATKPEDAGPNV